MRGACLVRKLAGAIEPELGSGFGNSPVLSAISNCVRTADAIELDAASSAHAACAVKYWRLSFNESLQSKKHANL